MLGFRNLATALIALSAAVSASSWAEGLQRASVQLNGHTLAVELAISDAERAQGLMHRQQLAADQGMLFIQPQPMPAAFWMKNTLIPLDMLFFDQHGQLLMLHQDVPPCKTPQCPTYQAPGAVKYILELNAGQAQQLGVTAQTRLELGAEVAR